MADYSPPASGGGGSETFTEAAYEAYMIAQGHHDVTFAAYGATGDGTTDDITAINAAITAANPGDTVFFPTPAASYKISTPILAAENVTLLGTHSPRWSYQGGAPNVIKATAGFTGVALIHVTGTIDGGRIRNLALDGGLVTSGTPDGIRITQLCRDWEITDCDVSSVDGDGYALIGPTTFPRGIKMSRCSAYNCGDDGFLFTNTTDSLFTDLLAVNCGGDGIVSTNCYESTFTDCRAVFNTGSGFHLNGDGVSSSSDSQGQTTLLAPSTDRNGGPGIRFAQEGGGPCQIISPRLRRDGEVIASSTDSCGIKIVGTSGADDAADVDIVAPQITVGVDDGGAGDESPLYGIRVTNAGRVSVHGGEVWGVTNSFAFTGTNDDITVSHETRTYNGNRAGKAAETVAEKDPVPASVPETYTVQAVDTKTGAYTLTLTDAGKLIIMNGDADITVPANSSVAFPTGTQVAVILDTGHTGNIIDAAGVQLNGETAGAGSLAMTANQIVVLTKIATDRWNVSGV